MEQKKRRALILAGAMILGIGVTSCNSQLIQNSGGIPSNPTILPSIPSSSVPVQTPTSIPTYSHTGTIVTNGDVIVSKATGQIESAYVEFETVKGVNYNLYLSNSDGPKRKLTKNDYYLREISNTHSRVDILGLKAGEYVLQIAPVVNQKEQTEKSAIINLTVESYDRSGYAHFNNKEGVGAYNDDGTLKDNAVVLYVTDENKNDIELTVGDKTVKGIGNILNSAGQETTDPGHEGQCKKVSGDKTYYATANKNAGIIKDLSDNNIPLVVRFVGVVSDSGLYSQGTFDAAKSSLIEGLTAYNSNDYGGTVKDNGHMARIKSGRNITLEGVGNDAAIDGWGVHFICESANPEYGKSFEIRNLCFMNNPEDAIGMEGVQDNGVISASVERCWIHHNTFLKPTISSPAESDKADGDGSCDFKRGQYFTMSYCYFEYCHKTNLIGSSDSSLQYNISFHHNLWYNCGSRIPLLRQANVHFYNNYVYGNINDDLADLSYISSLRANSYMYSENNYYEGCKQIFDKKSGTAKSFGNTYVQCFNTENSFDVATREESVESNCAYNGISYKNFDTNSSLFYYDSTKKVSDCYLTDSVTAKEECIKNAGSAYRTVINQTALKTTSINYVDRTMEGVDLNTTTSVTFGSDVKGIEFVASKNKFKDIGLIFKLNGYATCTIDLSCSNSSSMSSGYLLKNNGEVCIAGSGTTVLSPGIYIIKSCTMDKESTLNSLSFEKYNSEEYAKEAVEQYNKKIQALSNLTVEFTDNYYEVLRSTIDAYDSIPTDHQNEVDYQTLASAIERYKSIAVNKVEVLIDAIGTVTESSLSAISSADEAYNKILSQFIDVVIPNLAKLQEAKEAFKAFELNACIKAIDAIGEVTLESKNAIDLALDTYNSLSDENKSLVTNYDVLMAAVSRLSVLIKLDELNSNIDSASSFEEYQSVVDEYYKLTEEEKTMITDSNKLNDILVGYEIMLIDSIGDVSLESQEVIKLAKNNYELLSDENKALITNYEILVNAQKALDELLSSVIIITFKGLNKDDGETNPSGGYPIFKYGIITIEGNPKSGVSLQYNGTTYEDAMKIESKTHIKFTLTTKKTITLVTDGFSESIKINGKEYTTDASGVLKIELESGDYDITKKDSMNLFAIILG